jgi:hypothetical protein
MQTARMIRISLPGRHCPCGAVSASTSRRCQKCHVRASWYRHNCRTPQRGAARAYARAHTQTRPAADSRRSDEGS